MEQIATFLSSPTLQRNPGRRAAMVVNVAVALLQALKVAVKEAGSAAGRLNPATDKVLQELLQVSDMVLIAAALWLMFTRNSSSTPIQLFGQLALRRSGDYATILEIPLPIRQLIGLWTLSLRSGNPTLVLAVLLLWVVFIPRSVVWRLVCI